MSDGYRKVFEGEYSPDIWITDSNPGADKYVLVTVSGEKGENTALLSSDRSYLTKAKHFVQAPKERKVKGTDRLRSQVAGSIKVAGYIFAIIIVSFSLLSFAGVTKARIVLTESMAPSINPGDIVLTLSPERMPPQIGDVVTYTAKRFDGSPVANFTHRIISGNESEGFVLKGDNNPSPDTQKPKGDDILGVVFYTIPLIGKLLTPKGLLILVPSIFGLWLIIDALRNEK